MCSKNSKFHVLRSITYFMMKGICYNLGIFQFSWVWTANRERVHDLFVPNGWCITFVAHAYEFPRSMAVQYVLRNSEVTEMYTSSINPRIYKSTAAVLSICSPLPR